MSFVRSSAKIRLDLESSDGFPFLLLGGKIVYYLEVNIADLPSASKSGKAHEIILTAEQLVIPVIDTENS